MSDTPMKLVVDVAKGTQEYIPLTTEEIAQREADATAFAAKKHEEDAKAAAEAEAKASAEAKLSTLGLSAEEIAALTK